MRHSKFIIVTGATRIGKSNETLRTIVDEYAVASPGKKALIVDTNGEYGAYKLHYANGSQRIINIPVIPPEHLLHFSASEKPEVKRIILPYDATGQLRSSDDMEALCIQAIQEFRGGCIFIDDLNNIFGDSLPKNLSGFLCNYAHRGSDLIIQLQSVGRILPKMRQNVNLVRFHYQRDSVNDSKNKLKDEYSLFKISQLIVDKQYNTGNIRFYLWIDRDYKKIRGRFNKKMMLDAIDEYVGLNYSTLVKPLVNKRNISGQKAYTDNQAMNYIRAKFLIDYYGNGA